MHVSYGQKRVTWIWWKEFSRTSQSQSFYSYFSIDFSSEDWISRNKKYSMPMTIKKRWGFVKKHQKFIMYFSEHKNNVLISIIHSKMFFFGRNIFKCIIFIRIWYCVLMTHFQKHCMSIGLNMAYISNLYLHIYTIHNISKLTLWI